MGSEVRKMAKAIVDEKVCKGCGLCISVCPKKLLRLATERMNDKGYNPAVLSDESACIGCAMCGIICPDSAITVEK